MRCHVPTCYVECAMCGATFNVLVRDAAKVPAHSRTLHVAPHVERSTLHVELNVSVAVQSTLLGPRRRRSPNASWMDSTFGDSGTDGFAASSDSTETRLRPSFFAR